MSSHYINVPATTAEVKSFLDSQRSKFVRDLSAIRKAVEESIQALDVYNVYGRSDKQNGEPLKSPRKVRLKFNDFFQRQGATTGSLWSTPDIIGFSIIVAFPSDITKVCEKLDALIEDGKLTQGKIPPGGDVAPIATKYGRIFSSGGYFGCHYNVTNSKFAQEAPLCEIQIKTVMHDAWGAKSHDLTYKPSGRISADMIESFNLLGDTLAKIDLQSDVIRNSIERIARVRRDKKSAVMRLSMSHSAKAGKKDPELTKIIADIESGKCLSGSQVWRKYELTLRKLFPDHKRDCCLAYCYLASISSEPEDISNALEALESWYETETDDFGRATAKGLTSLAHFSFGDSNAAIEEAESADAFLDKVNSTSLDEQALRRYHRSRYTLHSNLSYYHAERIGSHEGRLGDSSQKAEYFLGKTLSNKLSPSALKNGVLSDLGDIASYLQDPTTGTSGFASIDTEVFVRIQTASSIDEIKRLRKVIELINDKAPPEYVSTARLLSDFHDFCARERLAELEQS